MEATDSCNKHRIIMSLTFALFGQRKETFKYALGERRNSQKLKDGMQEAAFALDR